ncbi:MAG: hypothetical protein JWL65_7258 [Gammaproteobacteria bacterium]|nr:hypothetical protein [Gammaproteobacteria bacterium]
MTVTRKAQITTVGDYIAECPRAVQPVLRKLRATVRKAVPQATECISYRMPAYKLHGVVVYFAAFKQHIGVFPPVRGTPELMKAVAPYAGPKGNLRFPLAKPIPFALIARIARQHAKDNLHRIAHGASKKRSAS